MVRVLYVWVKAASVPVSIEFSLLLHRLSLCNAALQLSYLVAEGLTLVFESCITSGEFGDMVLVYLLYMGHGHAVHGLPCIG